MIIAIDFDGTLCEHKYPAIGKPNVELIHKLKLMVLSGNKLILWTCRHNEKLNEAVKWCEEYGLSFAAINDDVDEIKNSQFGKEKSKKIFADMYIDDRNVLIKSL